MTHSNNVLIIYPTLPSKWGIFGSIGECFRLKWKELRKEYLETQKGNMHELKRKLAQETLPRASSAKAANNEELKSLRGADKV